MPIIGYLIFYIYYVPFKKWGYNIKKRPFVIIKSSALKIHENIDDKIDELSEFYVDEQKQLSEYYIRALEDYAVHSYINKGVETRRKRLEFLFSAFHSLGATIAAIWLGIASWVLFGCFNWIISGSLVRLSDAVFFVFCLFAAIWFIISLFLLWSWDHRKELAIKEEAFLAAIARHEIGEVIEANKKIDATIQGQKEKGEL